MDNKAQSNHSYSCGRTADTLGTRHDSYKNKLRYACLLYTSYLSDNSANIIVKSSGLDTAQAAQIKSALLSEVEVAGENITIVEVQ